MVVVVVVFGSLIPCVVVRRRRRSHRRKFDSFVSAYWLGSGLEEEQVASGEDPGEHVVEHEVMTKIKIKHDQDQDQDQDQANVANGAKGAKRSRTKEGDQIKDQTLGEFVKAGAAGARKLLSSKVRLLTSSSTAPSTPPSPCCLPFLRRKTQHPRNDHTTP